VHGRVEVPELIGAHRSQLFSPSSTISSRNTERAGKDGKDPKRVQQIREILPAIIKPEMKPLTPIQQRQWFRNSQECF
jgi:hypothetical protein